MSQIANTIGVNKPETGGILGMSRGIIDNYYFDADAITASGFYYPHIARVNQIVNEEWATRNVSFCGFVHSHEDGLELSYADKEYAKELLKAVAHLRDSLHFLVVNPKSTDADFSIRAYTALSLPNGEVAFGQADIIII